MSNATSLDAEAVASGGANFGLKDEIRAYWSKRAETFDLSYGHRIRSDAELEAWARLIASHAPVAAGARALELASGTGEITRVLLSLGCSVDAIDLCEPMIARAQVKHANAAVRFHLGDAENTMMADEAYDLVICRHLVWTLIDPARALADWLRVLRPGGALIVIDGDWVTLSRRSVLLKRLSGLVDRLTGVASTWDQATHQRILNGVHFRDGLRAPALEAMLREAGFEPLRVGPLSGIARRQFATASWSERLRLLAAQGQSFILSARKPG
ncbi:ubiquinone/menaquinone biosynthesis C-methylase UbiE [Bosea sp. BE125]|uniref:class I SAM-dependent methyltransferase n=1 Tax=Bosea sp. BE125 TaxID=2817909 RepID=UPI00286786A1|nr:methyltransferase domain-containing protein [Bosea sp. BE125]MDR6873599.1 ubiquinone/menaquinone biosynthesis C-methylase UbiE [Bosea sp. BE125]